MELDHFSPSYMCMCIRRASGNLLRSGEAEYISRLLLCTYRAGQARVFLVLAFMPRVPVNGP